MSLLIFQHDPHETAGVLGGTLQTYGHRLRIIELFNGHDVPADLDDVDGIVSMGGPMNVQDAGEHRWIEPEQTLMRSAHEAGLPIVGICLGAQLLGSALGGKVEPMDQPEVGFAGVKLAFPGTIDPVMAGIRWDTMQVHAHGQQVTGLPPNATPLAGSALCRMQAFRVGMTSYGFQYHFEWDRPAIEKWIGRHCPLVGSAGLNAADIDRQCDEHYDAYRHVGDRLCDNLAMLLFSVGKRARLLG